MKATKQEVSRRDIQKIRSKNYPVKVKLTHPQLTFLLKRYNNVFSASELVLAAIEEVTNKEAAKL